jgi:hypothetical protein
MIHQGRRNRNRGKASQKAVAEILEGLNIGTLGGEDVLTAEYSIEVKSTKRCVVDKWYQQAVENNKRKVTPMVVLHITGKHHINDYVILKITDFLKLKGEDIK